MELGGYREVVRRIDRAGWADCLIGWCRVSLVGVRVLGLGFVGFD